MTARKPTLAEIEIDPAAMVSLIPFGGRSYQTVVNLSEFGALSPPTRVETCG